MPAKDWVILLLTHPLEFKTLVQFWLYHQKADRDIEHESQWKHTAYNRGTMKRCWEFLDLTSRSFAAVIKELDGDLARTVSTRIQLTRAHIWWLIHLHSDLSLLPCPPWVGHHRGRHDPFRRHETTPPPLLP
jgi:hypothetical protein